MNGKGTLMKHIECRIFLTSLHNELSSYSTYLFWWITWFEYSDFKMITGGEKWFIAMLTVFIPVQILQWHLENVRYAWTLQEQQLWATHVVDLILYHFNHKPKSAICWTYCRRKVWQSQFCSEVVTYLFLFFIFYCFPLQLMGVLFCQVFSHLQIV